jgi:hypothetical protein
MEGVDDWDKSPSLGICATPRRSTSSLGIAEMSQSAPKAKDAALRMVGRTVVNFQRLEHNLKVAARLGPLDGTIQKIQKDIARRHERASALSLGQAIQAWLVNCDEPPARSAGTADLFDVSVQMAFSLGLDAESRIRHAEVLGNLLKLRNDLIHLRLAKFEWDSPNACNGLIAELDQVNTTISEQIEYTHLLLKSIAELNKEHADAIASMLATGPS